MNAFSQTIPQRSVKTPINQEVPLTKEFYSSDDETMGNVLKIEVMYDPIKQDYTEIKNVWVNNRQEDCKATVFTSILEKKMFVQIGKTKYTMLELMAKSVDWKEVYHQSKEK